MLMTSIAEIHHRIERRAGAGAGVIAMVGTRVKAREPTAGVIEVNGIPYGKGQSRISPRLSTRNRGYRHGISAFLTPISELVNIPGTAFDIFVRICT
jgi:hypothetical protein